MSKLSIPGTAGPNNLHYGTDVRASIVDGDLYDICTRLEEVDPSLFIVALESPDGKAFAIMEHCDDGWDRLIWRVPVLDQRVLRKAEYLKKVPFEKRFEEAEKVEERMKAEEDAKAFEDLYENLGAPMLRQLRHDGFTDGNFTDYRKISKR